jgi:SAM-dependent methyltransferase
MDWRSYWNERYGRVVPAFGNEPNQCVASIVPALPVGRALDMACGRGRNAVWLAETGHQVTAVDLSDVAVAKGRELAARRGVDVDYRVANVLDWDPPQGAFDLVLLSYLQLPPPERVIAHSKAEAALAPGGRVLIVAHHSDNLVHGVGGPQMPEVLYDEELLAGDFGDLTVERNERVIRHVDSEDMVGDAIDVVFLARLQSAA